jgi:hypothetical protein
MKGFKSFFLVLCLSLTSFAFNETESEYFRDLWLNAIKKSNESLLRQNQKNYDDDFEHLIDVLSKFKSTDDHWNLFQNVKTVLLQNSYERIFGFKIGMFTNFCGPGDVAGANQQTVCGFFGSVDKCCKAHDACDHFITSKADYVAYPNLPSKQLRFSSLSCECDAAFYNCIKQTNSIFGEVILGIYSVAQTSCFQLDYKIEKCAKYDE